MIIGGLQKSSLLDYPSKVSAIIFTAGCNFRCGFCHNPGLVTKIEETEILSEKDIFDFLESRKGKLDAVSITGGEPTLHHDLPDLMHRIKAMGYLVKLDSNGTNPEMLEEILHKGLVDYLAMDIKHRVEKDAYERAIQAPIDIENIKRSIRILMESGIAYEFRTTLVEGLHSKEDVVAMAQAIRGASTYALQKFIPRESLNDDSYKEKTTFSDETLEALRALCEEHVEQCFIR